MARVAQNLWFSGASFAALVLVAGCSGRSTYEPPIAAEPAPPPHVTEPSSDGTGLLGGPASKDETDANGLITFRRADGMAVTAMRPIANPEDATPRARSTGRGHRLARRVHHRVHRPTDAPRVQASIQAYHPAPAAQARPHIGVGATRVPQRLHAPSALPVHVTPAVSHPIPVPVRNAPKPPPPAPNSKGRAPAPAAKIVGPGNTSNKTAKTDSQSVAVDIPTPLAIPSDAKLAGLQAQLAPQVAKEARLDVPSGLTTGQTVTAHLTLPKNLLGSIQHEAPKHGLGAASKSVQIIATLMGDGYEIRPDGAQTRLLEASTPPDFTWQVKRNVGAAGPLRADVEADLAGANRPLNFALASVGPQTDKTTPIAPAPRTWLGPLDKNGQRTVLGVFLVLAAIFIAALIARNAEAQRRREQRRQRFTALSEYNLATGSNPAHQGSTDDATRAAQVRHDDEGHRSIED